jgi:hypothetical protein
VVVCVRIKCRSRDGGDEEGEEVEATRSGLQRKGGVAFVYIEIGSITLYPNAKSTDIKHNRQLTSNSGQ